MALLDQHFETAFDALDGIEKLRELILTLAMQGKLVEQDKHDSSVSQLLEKIAEERRRLLGKRNKKTSAFSEMKSEEMPHEIPKSWKWIKLGEIVIFTNGYAFKSSSFQENGIGLKG